MSPSPYIEDRREFFGSCVNVVSSGGMNPVVLQRCVRRDAGTATVTQSGATLPTAVDLLRELAATPDLPGAACVAEREVFDACLEKGCSHAYPLAIRICSGCAALRACSAWIESLPIDERPHGVTAEIVRGRYR